MLNTAHVKYGFVQDRQPGNYVANHLETGEIRFVQTNLGIHTTYDTRWAGLSLLLRGI